MTGVNEKHETVSLAMCEQATIVCDGAITVQLLLGTLEIDGALMAADVEYKLRTNAHRRVTLYTLSGGSFGVKSTSPFSIHKAESQVPKLLELIKVCARRPLSRILIFGEPRSGKSVAAKIIMNGLLRAHTGDVDCRHVYVEGDYSNGTVSCSGAIAAAECQPPSLPIESPFLDTVPVTFFVGHVNPVAGQAGQDLISLSQCMQCAEWMFRRGEHRTRHLVVDAPSVLVNSKCFMQQLIDLCQPTHVLALGSDSYVGWVGEEIAPDVTLMQHASLIPEALRASTTGNKSGETSIAEYFCGQISAPLVCACVVARLSDLEFVKVGRQEDVSLCAMRVDPGTLQVGALVAVSHAQCLEEVPYANTAGFMVIKDVSIKDDEIVLYAPEAEMIPRSFIVVGGSEMTCRPHLLAFSSI